MITTVIFDMDGVIIDSEPVHFEIERTIFKELQIDISAQEHHSFVGTSQRNMWEKIINKYFLTHSLEDLVELNRNRYMTYLAHSEQLQPIPGVADLIKQLHGANFKLVLASSSEMEVIKVVLSKFSLDHFFELRVSGAELLSSKPHPQIFLVAAKLAGSYPNECIVIEDSENGVRAARSAGMKCIAFVNPNSGSQDLGLANMRINSFNEISTESIRSF